MLEINGIICVAIDDEEASKLRFVLSAIFLKELGIVVVRSNPAGRKTKGTFAPAHEYAMFYGKSSTSVPMSLDISEKRLIRYPHKDDKGHFAWANFIRSGSNDKREDRPKLYYPIFVSKNDTIRIPNMKWDNDSSSYELLEEPLKGEDIVYPIVTQDGIKIEKNWQRGHNRVRNELEEYRIRRSLLGEISIDFKTRMDVDSLPTTWWDAKEYASANYGAAELKAVFGRKVFDFAKAQSLVKDCVIAAGGRIQNSVILDYFAGSGTTAHAIMKLNKDDGGKRKFILIESANYFETVTIPRIKKVAYSLNWKDGKPKDDDGNGVFFKYQVLEQYEDTLDNIELKENQPALDLFGSDYLLKYFLDFESRDNMSLVNFENFKNPFSYRLKVNYEEAGEPEEVIVDLPETFHYLLGLTVKKIKVRKDKGRKYLFSLCEKDDEGRDAFEDDYEFILDSGLNMDDLYGKVFGGRGQFRIHEIKTADGELGLQVGENDYFGVVNIGDVAAFKKELEKKAISTEPDAVSPSLFEAIKKEGSPIQVLIGSKKFIEGWDTWRVSSMGLLNIGTGQGPQIIQLFGRGIRLKGKEYSLKRSADKGALRCLETLHIYGLKADYLNRFLAAIKKEEVEFESIDIPVTLQYEKKWGQLRWLSKDENRHFEEDEILPLNIDPHIYVSLNLMPRVTLFVGKDRDRDDAVKVQEMKTEDIPRGLSESEIKLFNWHKIFEDIQEFKILRNYWNTVFSLEDLKNILLSDRYKIMALPDTWVMKSRSDLEKMEAIACQVLKKYINRFYVFHRQRYESKHMRYEMMKRQLALPLFEVAENQYAYTVQIDKKETKLIEDVKKLAEELDKLFKQEEKKILPRIYFDRHLYLPILLKGINRKIDKISPAGLEESEQDFLMNLKRYIEENKKTYKDWEIYLLRNFPKKGIGFFNLSGFYPDFIMWLKNKERQQIVFMDPHGLEHEKTLDNQKIQLSKDIKQLEEALGDKNISLDSFILSKTSYEDLTKGRTKPEAKQEFKDNHVLFLEDKDDWPVELFGKLM